MIVPLLAMPPETVLFRTEMPVALAVAIPPIALIVPVLAMPPETVLLVTESATVLVPTSAPGLIVPAFVTAPVTVEPLITIEVVALPAGLVTVATVWFVIVCPACAGAARRSAATEVPASNEEATRRKMRARGSSGRFGIRSAFRVETDERFCVPLLDSIREGATRRKAKS